MAAMTALGISKKQGFYNRLTERKRRRWREADAVFYIAERWKKSQFYGIIKMYSSDAVHERRLV